jgi:hydroxymethylbilane synthase
MADKKIRIGTRGSALALAQTELVIEALRKRFPEYEYEKVILSTRGDRILNVPLVDFGGKGAFVEEFEDRLENGGIDLAVHSAKDMPVELKEGLVIAGTLKREDVRDVLVCRKNTSKTTPAEKCENDTSNDTSLKLKNTVKIGTGSLRRQLQLKKILPDAECVPIRGNVPTRLKKLAGGEFDGIVLAAAGLKRLGLLDYDKYDYRFFDTEDMLPAGGQGIIAIEGRAADTISDMARLVSDEDTFAELVCERTVLNVLQAGCHEAVGIYAAVGKLTSELPDDLCISLRIMKESGGGLYFEHGEVLLEGNDINNKLKEGKMLAEKVAAQLLKEING